VIYGDDNAFTKTDGDIFTRELKAAGVDVVDTETFHIKDTDFQPALTRIESKHPDVIAIGALFPEATKIIQQAGKLGIKAAHDRRQRPQRPRHVRCRRSRRSRHGRPVRRGTPARSIPSNLDFVKPLHGRVRQRPDQFAAQSYAAAQIVGILVAHGATTKDEMLSGLHGVARSSRPCSAPIGFDSNRDVKSSPVILAIVKDGFTYFH